jgi:hypothetical protein
MEGLHLFEVFDGSKPDDVIARVEAFTAEDALRKFKVSRPELTRSHSGIIFKARNVYDKNRNGYSCSWNSDDNNGYF